MKSSHKLSGNTNRLDREDNCYALTLARRLKAMGLAKYQNDGDLRTSGPGFGVTCPYHGTSPPAFNQALGCSVWWIGRALGGRPRSVQRKAVSVEDMLTDHLVELIGQVSKPLNPVTHTARVQIARRGSAVCDFTADLDQTVSVFFAIAGSLTAQVLLDRVGSHVAPAALPKSVVDAQRQAQELRDLFHAGRVHLLCLGHYEITCALPPPIPRQTPWVSVFVLGLFRQLASQTMG